MTERAEEWLGGWDETPGIVSLWVEPNGHVWLWRRVDGRLVTETARIQPWLLAASLDDLAHLGNRLRRAGEIGSQWAHASYREVEGGPDTLRYLIEAPDWRALRRAVVEGVARRTGERDPSLSDLPEYAVLGLSEQYLIASGRAFFRGLSYDDLHRLQFDLETTALAPSEGRIFMAAVRDTRGLATTIEAAAPEDEPALIRRLVALIVERDPDIIENHNLFGFDLPFLEHRAALHGIPLALGRLPRQSALRQIRRQRRVAYDVVGRELVDTLLAVRRSGLELSSHGLKAVAQALGVAPKDRVYIPGAEIAARFRDDPAQVRRYALDDVTEVEAISPRLLGPAFALAGIAPRRFSELVTAGPAMGVLEPMLLRAYLRAGVAPPQRPPYDSGAEPHAGGAVRLFASGVAEHVVKVDVASMYPSIMRTFRIGSGRDRLGVLLALVDQLTVRRLEHKQAARQFTPGSLEHARHTAMQSAMKLIINSAYGYLGATTMARFADRDAADAITAHGRAILDQLIGALERRGVALLEADTDGIFFAVPAGWDDATVRALVDDLDEALPAAIKLELEGRYLRMYSLEVKNYVLLTQEGQLIIKGGALRSSRAERFGLRFLEAAFAALLRGDVCGLYERFQATVTALRTRQLAAADVATRVRLTKRPEQYERTRAGHREAAYEALLEAGQTWRPGDRIRFYRAEGGRVVWLPEGEEESQAGALDDARDYDVGHYLHVLLTSYAGRLRKAFAPADFDQLFRLEGQLGLFDRPVEEIQPLWIRCEG